MSKNLILPPIQVFFKNIYTIIPFPHNSQFCIPKPILYFKIELLPYLDEPVYLNNLLSLGVYISLNNRIIWLLDQTISKINNHTMRHYTVQNNILTIDSESDCYRDNVELFNSIKLENIYPTNLQSNKFYMNTLILTPKERNDLFFLFNTKMKKITNIKSIIKEMIDPLFSSSLNTHTPHSIPNGRTVISLQRPHDFNLKFSEFFNDEDINYHNNNNLVESDYDNIVDYYIKAYYNHV